MFDRLTARPLIQRGLGFATAGLLVAGSLFVPAAVHATGLPPIANPDHITTGVEDTVLHIDTSALLLNDSDPENDTLTVTAVGNAVHGTVQLVGTDITFTPTQDKCDPDNGGFQYDLSDGDNGPTIGTVTVDLACVDDAPTATPDTIQGHEDDPSVITDHDLVANDDDIDTDNNSLFIASASNATNGSVSYNAVTHDVTFTPTAGLCDPTQGSFKYTVSDGSLVSGQATVTVNLTCNIANSTPVGHDDLVSGIEDTNVVTAGSFLTGNDTDADSDPLTVTAVGGATGGSVHLGGGNVTFTPNANLCGAGAGHYIYAVSDGTNSDFSVGVTVNLTCTNDAPVAVADFATVAVNSAGVDYSVVTNDTDVDGDTLHLTTSDAIVSVVPSAAGTAVKGTGLNSDKIHFTPAAGFHGQGVVTYKITDGTTTAMGTLTITIGTDVTPPVVAVPTAAFGSGRVNESAPIRINWSATDASSGVASYRVQVSVGGASFRNVYIGTGKTITKSYPFGKSLVWRVRATDNEGNVSGWVSSATRRIVAVQENNGAIHRTGTWTRVITSGASGNGYGFTANNHKAAGVQFTGRSVLYVAPKSTAAGFVKVYVDGHLIGRINVHSGSFAQGRIIARASWTTSGAHNILIVNDQAGKRANLDAFIVLR